jgi:hypothetical protein
MWPRRRPGRGTGVEVRRGPAESSPNLAVALADVCAEGVGVWLAEPVRPGEEVRVLVATPANRGVVLTAEVRWCAPGPDATYRAGLRLRALLTDGAVAELSI